MAKPPSHLEDKRNVNQPIRAATEAIPTYGASRRDHSSECRELVRCPMERATHEICAIVNHLHPDPRAARKNEIPSETPIVG